MASFDRSKILADVVKILYVDCDFVVDETTPLFGGEVELDSFAIMSILVGIEERWGIDLGDRTIDRTIWPTAGAIADMVYAELEAKQ